MTDGLKAHRTSGHVRPATIIDVAREAGVSFKTVSRVLNGETNVREETRLKVLEAVKTLNYRTNHNARNLRARHSHIICLFYANPSRNYIGEVQLGALQRCQAYGYSLITEDCSDNHTSLLALRAETKLAGAILTPPRRRTWSGCRHRRCCGCARDDGVSDRTRPSADRLHQGGRFSCAGCPAFCRLPAGTGRRGHLPRS